MSGCYLLLGKRTTKTHFLYVMKITLTPEGSHLGRGSHLLALVHEMLSHGVEVIRHLGLPIHGLRMRVRKRY